MKETIKERKQNLYNATTKARNHFLTVERKLFAKVKREHPELEWFDQIDIVYACPEWQKANGELQGLCLACSLMGIECGE